MPSEASGFGIIRSSNASRVFPFYVVCDVSRSMWDPAFNEGQPMVPLSVVEDSLPDMLAALEEDPVACDTAHLGIVAFGDSPQVILPLTPLAHDPAIPALPRQTSTNYAGVFEYMDRVLRADHQRFQSSGLGFYTPVIFFLTDGNPQMNGVEQPDSQWMHYRSALEANGHPFRPVVVALGIGTVTPNTVRKLRSTKPMGVACVADSGVVPGDLLRAIINSIRFSITNSVGHGEFQFRTPRGMRRLD
jgi:uncharacterized protein YegL